MARVHESITLDRFMEAVERAQSSLDNPGFCTACGEETDGCEPDAERYECESCGARAVFGAEQLLMAMGGVLFLCWSGVRHENRH